MTNVIPIKKNSANFFSLFRRQCIVLYLLIKDGGQILEIENLNDDDFPNPILLKHFLNMRELSRQNLKYDLTTYLSHYATGPIDLDFLKSENFSAHDEICYPVSANFDFYLTDLRKYTHAEKCNELYSTFQKSEDKEKARVLMNLEFDRLENKSLDQSFSLQQIAGLMQDEFWSKLENPQSSLLKCNIFSLDEIFSSVNGPFLFVIGARPGIGKSAFALQLSWESAAAGKRVGFISLELSLVTIAMRLTSYSKKFNLTDLFLGEQKTVDDYFSAPLDVDRKIYVEKPEDRSIDHLIKRIHLLAKRDKVDFIVIDHLRNVTGALDGTEEHRVLRMFMEKLYHASHTLKLPLVILTQLNRECESPNARPKMSWIQGSSAIEQYADACLFMYVTGEDPTNPNYDVTFRLMKSRSTMKIGIPPIEFHGAIQTFMHKMGDKPMTDVFSKKP